jgi:hypothetical protein
MTREHYVVGVNRNRRRLFLLWFTNEEDGFVADGARLRAFSSADEALAGAAASSLSLGDTEVTWYDLDEIETWILAPNRGTPHVDRLLNAWNLLADVSSSVGDQVAAARLFDRATFPAYDRLVNSGNLPAMDVRPAVGELSEGDRRAIAAVLRHGLSCLTLRLPPSENLECRRTCPRFYSAASAWIFFLVRRASRTFLTKALSSSLRRSTS